MTALAILALAATAADLTGAVEDLKWQPDGSATMLVVDRTPDKNKVDRAAVRLPKYVKVVDRHGRDARPFLRNGVEIAVRFKGPVAESYPVQATAGSIRLLKEPFYTTGILARAESRQPYTYAVLKPGTSEVMARFTLDRSTKIWEEYARGRRVPKLWNALVPGRRVSFDYEGAVAMIYPPNGRAAVVVVHRNS